jgi:hypothetical protein
MNMRGFEQKAGEHHDASSISSPFDDTGDQ